MIPRRRFTKRTRFVGRGRRTFRPFAARVRPKYDKITLFNNLDPNTSQCGPLVKVNCQWSDPDAPCPPHGDPTTGRECCGPNLSTIQLIDNAVLESYFQDRVTIVRLYGDLWCRNVVQQLYSGDRCNGGNDQFILDNYVARYMEQWSLGLHKHHLTEQAQELVGDDDRANPMYVYDATETRWLWQRYKLWEPPEVRQSTVLVGGSSIGVCSDVHGGATNIVPPIASGSQPTYEIDTNVSTTCQIVQVPNEGCAQVYNTIQTRQPPWHHWRLSIKRHIALRGDDFLNLQIGMRHPAAPGNSSGWGCVNGSVAETSNTTIFCRIMAVVRLN